MHLSIRTLNLQEERAAVGSVEIPGYVRRNRNVTETNIDMILVCQQDVFGANDEFSFNGRLGSNVRRNSVEAISASTNGGLVVPGVYALSNSVNTPNAPGETAYQTWRERSVRCCFSWAIRTSCMSM